MPGVGKGVPVSEKGSQARTEAGARSGLTKASTRTCVLTSRGQEGLYTKIPGRKWGHLGHTAKWKIYGLCNHFSHYLRTHVEAQVHAG